MRTLIGAFLAFAVGAVTAVTAAGPAHADEPCAATGFAPRHVVVGLRPSTATFRAETPGCTPKSWSVESEAFSADSANRAETFYPFTNDDSGPHDIVLSSGSESERQEQVLVNGFALKRNSGWQSRSVSASAQRARSKVTIKARLVVADWDEARYVAAADQPVTVQFRTRAGRYATVRTVQTSSSGWVAATVPAEATGLWRLSYQGSLVAGPATTTGHWVSVAR